MKEKKLEAALAFVLIQLIFYVIFWNKYIVYSAIISGFLLGAVPPIQNAFYWGWTKLLTAINFVTSKILLSVIYFFVLLPISFFVKGSKKMNISKKAKDQSMFVERNHLYKKKDLENLW